MIPVDFLSTSDNLYQFKNNLTRKDVLYSILGLFYSNNCYVPLKMLPIFLRADLSTKFDVC